MNSSVVSAVPARLKSLQSTSSEHDIAYSSKLFPRPLSPRLATGRFLAWSGGPRFRCCVSRVQV
jgi:hypothetical protein